MDERAEDAETSRRMRIAPDEIALGLGTQSFGARPGPGDEEALLGGQSFAGRGRVCRKRTGERPVGEPHAAEIADGLALDPLAVETQAGLDLEGGVRVVDAGGARLKLRSIGVAPPARRPSLGVEVGAASVEGVGEIVGDADADAAVEPR